MKLTPCLEKFTFEGVETICVKTASCEKDLPADGKEITLHAKELSFQSASYTLAGEDGLAQTDAEEVSYLGMLIFLVEGSG